jgi:hypothetical protein
VCIGIKSVKSIGSCLWYLSSSWLWKSLLLSSCLEILSPVSGSLPVLCFPSCNGCVHTISVGAVNLGTFIKFSIYRLASFNTKYGQVLVLFVLVSGYSFITFVSFSLCRLKQALSHLQGTITTGSALLPVIYVSFTGFFPTKDLIGVLTVTCGYMCAFPC